MASIEDRRSIGQEIVLRVRSTGNGVKVVEFDGLGFAEGIMTKRNRRYFYGDDAAEKAAAYAYRKQPDIAEARRAPVFVVELGERIAEKLAEEHGGKKPRGDDS
jgi:hypothetical protein